MEGPFHVYNLRLNLYASLQEIIQQNQVIMSGK